MSMSVSAVFGCRMMTPTHPTAALSSISSAIPRVGINCSGLVIECSSRPKKKATAHHMKTRPRKRQPWDIKRKPTVYPPLPPLPPEWTLVSPAEAEPPVADVPSAPPPSS